LKISSGTCASSAAADSSPRCPAARKLGMEGQARLSGALRGQETARRVGPRPWGKLDAARPRRTSMDGLGIILTGGLCSCYVFATAGWRRADESPTNGRSALKEGNRRESSKQAGVRRRRRNEGLAPVREEIGSKRVRPNERTFFSARFCLARSSAHKPS
jgi:hypothetical protein